MFIETPKEKITLLKKLSVIFGYGKGTGANTRTSTKKG